ncbi:unnamed protein product [Pedinophyceae sp. YPF-701]|nr:unnamed protein product [Pedinophyceae sp. YPF-701]
MHKILKKNPKKGRDDAPAGPAKPSSTSKASAALAPRSAGSSAAGARSERPKRPDLTEASMARAYAEPLPSFRDVPAGERQALFVRKLHLCSFTFDFNEASKHVREKEMKRQALLELVDYVNPSGGQGKFTEAVTEDVVFMISSNLFRALPASRNQSIEVDSYDPDEEEPALEPAWPHLQIVYEFLLRYVVSNDTDAKVAKRYIDHSFVLSLLELFDSEDPRERDYLKTILHRIYGKFMVHRPFIRRAIYHVFYRFIFETERHNGVAELLEILGSIINGFALPLKEEHKQFLHKALMPLHKPKCVAMYHQQLAYCVTQFVEKDAKLASPVLRALMRFWPVTNSQKEVLFLGELEEILELTQTPEFVEVMRPLFRQVARCLNSSHFQVAERALFLWNNEYIVHLVASNRHAVLPVVFAALERNGEHWNAAVHSLTINVRKMFQEMDQPLYDECERRYQEEKAQQARKEQQRLARWKAVEEAAAGSRK